MEVLREVHNQHLTCSICMDQYTEPKQLPCLHSFCRRCLTTHILKSVAGSGAIRFQCPVCRKECKAADPDPNKVLEWSESFPDNFFINSLISTFEASTRSAESITVHDRLESLSVEVETCPTHRKETAMSYCVVKNTAACGLCLKTSVHDDCAHRHVTPEEARNIAGGHLRDFKLRVETLSSRVVDIDSSLAKKPTELKFKKDELAIDISDYFSDMKTKLNKLLLRKEKDALAELDDVMKREHTRVLEAKDETKSLSGSLKGTIQLFDKLMEDRPVGVLAVAQTVEKQIAAYEQNTHKLEDVFCKEVDIKLLKGHDIIGTVDNVPWGKIQSREYVVATAVIPPGDQSVVEMRPSQPDRTPTAHQKQSCINSDRRVNNSSASVTGEAGACGGASFSGACAPGLTHSAQNSREPSPHSDEPKSKQSRGGSPRKTTCALQSLPVEAASVQTSQTSPSAVHSPPSTLTDQSLLGAAASLPATLTSSATAQLLPADSGFNLKLVNEFCGLCPEDVHPASYVGMCPFGQNCLLILDRWNKKLKLAQIGGRILFVFKFDSTMEPWDVTTVSGEDVAVTCPSYSHFLMMKVLTLSMQISRHVKTVIGYSSLVHLRDNTYAGGVCKPFGSPRVDIVDASGHEATPLRQLSAHVTYPRTMELTSDRHLLLCDWSQKEVTVFDAGDFTQILRYKGAGKAAVFREPVAATKDRKGHIYVADRKLKQVHVVSRTTGEMLAVLSIDVPSDPKVIVVVESEEHYSRQGEVLVVATGGGKLFVYELSTP